MNEYDHNKGGSSLFTKVGAGLLVVLIVAVLSFLGGMQYQKGKKSATTDQTASGGPSSQNFGNFQGGTGGGRMNIVLGQVTAISSTSISIQDSRSNSTTTLDITSSTQVTDNGEAASVSSIKVGDNVVVRPNSSNSKQADQIILNPQAPSGGAAPSTTVN